MSRYNDLNLVDVVKMCIGKGNEGDFWDFKQEWHENMADLIKDIICLLLQFEKMCENTPYKAGKMCENNLV